MIESRTAVLHFLGEFFEETKPFSDDTDLFHTFGIDGDEAGDFMDRFASQFDVNADNYRWYFHHGEEGINFGGVFFAPPNRRVKRIPITLRTLVEAAETKTWPINYPDHELPRVRWDIRFNAFVTALALGGLVLWFWNRFIT